MSNRLTLTNIENIIENHFETERNFMFVVDRDTAEYIVEYIDDVFGLEDEGFSGFKDGVDEYYVSVYFDRDEDYSVFCENARVLNGRYKYSELDNCDYFVQEDTGMCEITADKVLLGEGCTWSWFEIVDDDEDNYYGEYGEFKYCGGCGCDDCCDCEEIDDETQEEIKLIEHLAHKYEGSECICGACLRNTLYEAYTIGRGIGRQDIIDSFRGLLDTIDECH